MEYTQESISALVHDLVDKYEETFDIEYGAVPEVKIVNFDEFHSLVVKEYEKSLGSLSDTYLEELEKVNRKEYDMSLGIYMEGIHSVIITEKALEKLSQESSKDSFDYVLAHEVAHGFQHNFLENKFGPNHSMLSLDKKDGLKYFSEQIYYTINQFVKNVALDGHAEIMASQIATQYRDEMPDANKTAENRVKSYNVSDRSYDKSIATLKKSFDKAINNEGNSVYLSDAQNITDDVHNIYRLGRAYVQRKMEREGKDISWFLENMPSSPDDLF